MKKRILALVLSVAMVLSFVPFSAFAAETTATASCPPFGESGLIEKEMVRESVGFSFMGPLENLWFLP